jgi:hypothetical protein
MGPGSGEVAVASRGPDGGNGGLIGAWHRWRPHAVQERRCSIPCLLVKLVLQKLRGELKMSENNCGFVRVESKCLTLPS